MHSSECVDFISYIINVFFPFEYRFVSTYEQLLFKIKEHLLFLKLALRAKSKL